RPVHRRESGIDADRRRRRSRAGRIGARGAERERLDPLRPPRAELSNLPLWSRHRTVLWRPVRRLSGLADVEAPSRPSSSWEAGMTRHLFKLVWNRKRTNALIILEIFFSFLVVFLVSTLGIFVWDNYRRPLGFSYQNVWRISVDAKRGSDDDPAGIAEGTKVFARLLAEVRNLAPVEAATGALVSPYDQGGMGGNWTINGKPVEMELDIVDESFAEVLGLPFVTGRWLTHT